MFLEILFHFPQVFELFLFAYTIFPIIFNVLFASADSAILTICDKLEIVFLIYSQKSTVISSVIRIANFEVALVIM